MWEALRPARAAMSRNTGTGAVSLGPDNFFFAREGGIFETGPIGPCGATESKPPKAIMKNNSKLVIGPARMQSDCIAGPASQRVCGRGEPVFNYSYLRQTLKDELQRQLQNACLVRGSWAKEARRARQTRGIARRVIGPSITDNRAAAVPRSGVSASRSAVTAQPVEFRVIKYVERFGAEFEVLAL